MQIISKLIETLELGDEEAAQAIINVNGINTLTGPNNLLYFINYKENNVPEILKFLIKNNIIIDHPNFDNLTALMLAVINDNLQIAEYLIANGADVNLTDVSDKTPLHFACQNKNKKMIELLLKNNAKPNIRNVFGGTPIDVLLNSYVEDNDSIILSNNDNEIIEILKILVAAGAIIYGIEMPDYINSRMEDLIIDLQHEQFILISENMKQWKKLCQENEELKLQNNQIIGDYSALQNNNLSLIQKYRALTIIEQELRDKVLNYEELENKVIAYELTIKELKERHNNDQRYIDDLKNKNVPKLVQDETFILNEQEIGKLKSESEYAIVQKNNLSLLVEQEHLQKEILSFDIIVKELNAENERLKSLVDGLSFIHDKTEQQYKARIAQLEDCMPKLDDEDLEEQISSLESQLIVAKQDAKMYESSYKNVLVINEELQNDIKKKDSQISTLKNEYDIFVKNTQSHEVENIKLREMIDEIRQENVKFKEEKHLQEKNIENHKDMDHKYREAKEEIRILKNDIEVFNRAIVLRDEGIDGLRRQVSSLSEELKNFITIRELHTQARDQVASLIRENETLKNNLTFSETLASTRKQQYESVLAANVKIREEIDLLQKENEDLKKKLKVSEDVHKEHHENIFKIIKEIDHLKKENEAYKKLKADLISIGAKFAQ